MYTYIYSSICVFTYILVYVMSLDCQLYTLLILLLKFYFPIMIASYFFLLGKEDGEGQEILEMVKNREDWYTAMLGVTKSWTQLSD